jgi:hypothetical protein
MQAPTSAGKSTPVSSVTLAQQMNFEDPDYRIEMTIDSLDEAQVATASDAAEVLALTSTGSFDLSYDAVKIPVEDAHFPVLSTRHVALPDDRDQVGDRHTSVPAICDSTSHEAPNADLEPRLVVHIHDPHYRRRQ